MRNFWCKANVDGRKSLLSFGPRGKEAGMGISIFANDKGISLSCVHVDCAVNKENLVITILALGRDAVTITIPKEK